MIFVTVGTQLPFDRLVQDLDAIAPELSVPIFAQTGVSTYVPKNFEATPMVSSSEFNALMTKVSIIVGHAGIGTIISAQKHGKPLILVPRKAALREHRNDHQLATVNSLRGRSGIYVAESEDELRTLLLADLAAPDASEAAASRDRLRSAVARFIHAG